MKGVTEKTRVRLILHLTNQSASQGKKKNNVVGGKFLLIQLHHIFATCARVPSPMGVSMGFSMDGTHIMGTHGTHHGYVTTGDHYNIQL